MYSIEYHLIKALRHHNKTSQFTQNKGILRKEIMRSVLLLNTVQILKSESSARGTSHNKHFSSAFIQFSLIVADQNENIPLQERGEKRRNKNIYSFQNQSGSTSESPNWQNKVTSLKMRIQAEAVHLK